TIDLYIVWNWHEPEEGKLDFDGRTNPRRDVKRLLEMIAEMGFAVVARPGPVILNEWRNGGYPDWLLARPEFQMNEVARLDGHYPPLAGVSASNSEEASRQWLANESHQKYTRRWFGDVMRELLANRQATNGGNLIAIQLDDDQAINRANYNGPVFWKYMNTLAGYLREAGAGLPLYLNPTDMRVSAAGAPHGLGVMGQWYFNFGSDPALRWEDTATLQFYVETLKTQPHFPPMIIEYQAGWYGTGDDAYAKTADPSNTLLSSRVMLGQGLRGLNYFPVQDTLYPAGYEVPWANHYYTWESALNLNREERPRAAAVHRNGRLIAGLGRELASVHKAADLGLVYPISSYDQASLTRDDILRISRAQMQIQQYCQLNQVAVEYVDLEFQPLEALKRHKALLLPVFDEKTAAQGREEISAANEPSGREKERGRQGDEGKLRLSETVQRKLVDYVKAGGKLFVTPTMPQGDPIRQVANELVVIPDFWRGIPIEPGGIGYRDLIAKVQASSPQFADLLRAAGVQPGVRSSVLPTNLRPASRDPNFIAMRLVGGDGDQAYGFVSVVNFAENHPTWVRLLNVIDPRGGSSDSRINLPEFRLGPRDAMLLPLRLPVDERSDGEIYYATAELIRCESANGRIRMRFYAPETAEVALRLPHAPQGDTSIDGFPASADYD
ncbi:MAG: alpha-amylase family protein, partial [Blastocatellia bacterium]